MRVPGVDLETLNTGDGAAGLIEQFTLPEFSLPLLLAAFDDVQFGMLIVDGQSQVLHASKHIPQLLGLEQEGRLENQDAAQLLSISGLESGSAALAIRRLAELIDGSQNASDLLYVPKQNRHLRMRVRRIGEAHRIASFHVVAPEAGSQLRVSEFPISDSLTGLASRNSFEAAVTEAVKDPNNTVAVLLVDLDRFKAVNDTLGHGAGDRVLKLAAERLKAAVRKTDLVARLGGDEFAVLIQPSRTLEEPTVIASRIMDLVQRTYFVNGELVNIGTSIGIAQSPEHGTGLVDLMKNADLALYHSKATGRGAFHFFADHMEQKAQARRTSELELRRALALRQLEVFYQAQVNTTESRLVGFEALLRWRHPERGMIPPSDFLPIAEEIGVIVPIGEWVLRTACKEAMNWPDDVTIAVNVSPLQFEKGDFSEAVQRALSGTGLPGRRLEIEITEGMLLRNDAAILETLQKLRAMEVRIAMDDFGTGYASLSQLSRFPFDKIKIDRSLAGFQGNDPKQRAIVRAITSLGQSLGVCTLAEGVEDADQIERLKLDGCTSVQGYYFSRPIPAEELGKILTRWGPKT